LQPARCAACDLGHRAPTLHPQSANARKCGSPGVSREPGGARLPAPRAAREGCIGHGALGTFGGIPSVHAVIAGARCRRRRNVSGALMSTAHHDFLVEIGTEELPPKALGTLAEAFLTGIGAGLEKASLAHGGIARFATPRRLAVRVERLAAQQPEQHVRRRGPPVSAAFDGTGAPTRAALAFAASCGSTVEGLERIEEGKGTFLYYVGTRAGERTVALLPGLVQTVLDQLPIPRRMHWGEGQ